MYFLRPKPRVAEEPAPAEKNDEGSSSGKGSKKGAPAAQKGGAQKKGQASNSPAGGKGKEKEKKPYYQTETYAEEEYDDLLSLAEQQIMETTGCSDLSLIRNLMQANGNNIDGVIGVLLDEKGPEVGSLPSDEKPAIADKGAAGALIAGSPDNAGHNVEDDGAAKPRASTSSTDTHHSTGTTNSSSSFDAAASQSQTKEDAPKKREKPLSSKEK